jgi:hypothetical protein
MQKAIDPRAPRFNQAVLTVGLLGGFALDVPVVIPALAVMLFLGAAFGPEFGPALRFFKAFIRPRLGAPAHVEDPRPPRFAATIGVAFLAAASLALLIGAPGLAWSLALVVAVLAGLAATTGICVGCEIYVLLARRSGVEVAHR